MPISQSGHMVIAGEGTGVKNGFSVHLTSYEEKTGKEKKKKAVNRIKTDNREENLMLVATKHIMVMK